MDSVTVGHLLSFVLGMMVGGCLGVLVLALVGAAGKEDE